MLGSRINISKYLYMDANQKINSNVFRRKWKGSGALRIRIGSRGIRSRYKWSEAFGHNAFSYGKTSSQGSESINNIFQHMSTKTLTLVEVFHHCEGQLKYLREIETQADYSSHERPKLQVSNNGILMHATSVYSPTIFCKFYEEFCKVSPKRILSTAWVNLGLNSKV